MALHIKSEEAHRLARRLAELTNRSMTQAVTEALREAVARRAPAVHVRRDLLDASADMPQGCRSSTTAIPTTSSGTASAGFPRDGPRPHR
jgi:hypothetical protein